MVANAAMNALARPETRMAPPATDMRITTPRPLSNPPLVYISTASTAISNRTTPAETSCRRNHSRGSSGNATTMATFMAL